MKAIVSEDITVEGHHKVRDFVRCLGASCSHALVLSLRRRRTILAAGVALTPALIPVLMAFWSSGPFAQNGFRVFVILMEMVYLRAMAPLMALFFACMLIGEEVESQTIHYVLTRPVPRLAWVSGKFLGYLVAGTLVLLPSAALTFAGCLALGSFPVSWASIILWLHYSGVLVMALLGYGAFCMFLGAVVRKPVVIGIVVFFGWQRAAMLAPGVVDFLTIEKYLAALLPKLAAERRDPVISAILSTHQKREILVGAFKAGMALLIIAAALVALTALVVRVREYRTERSVKG